MLPLMACWYQQLLSASCSILSCHQAPRPHHQQKYFVAAVRAFVKRSIYGQWLQPQYYVDVVVSWLLKMVGFSRTSSTSPSTVCGVVDLVTRLTLHASKACISFLNVFIYSVDDSLFYDVYSLPFRFLAYDDFLHFWYVERALSSPLKVLRPRYSSSSVRGVLITEAKWIAPSLFVELENRLAYAAMQAFPRIEARPFSCGYANLRSINTNPRANSTPYYGTLC